MKEELLQVCFRDKHGICPNCNTNMLLYVSTHQLLRITEYAVPTQELDYHTMYFNICPKCKFKLPMVKTIDGLRPLPLFKIPNEFKLEKNSPIGKVVVEGEFNE